MGTKHALFLLWLHLLLVYLISTLPVPLGTQHHWLLLKYSVLSTLSLQAVSEHLLSFPAHLQETCRNDLMG